MSYTDYTGTFQHEPGTKPATAARAAPATRIPVARQRLRSLVGFAVVVLAVLGFAVLGAVTFVRRLL